MNFQILPLQLKRLSHAFAMKQKYSMKQVHIMLLFSLSSSSQYGKLMSHSSVSVGRSSILLQLASDNAFSL